MCGEQFYERLSELNLRPESLVSKTLIAPDAEGVIGGLGIVRAVYPLVEGSNCLRIAFLGTSQEREKRQLGLSYCLENVLRAQSKLVKSRRLKGSWTRREESEWSPDSQLENYPPDRYKTRPDQLRKLMNIAI